MREIQKDDKMHCFYGSFEGVYVSACSPIHPGLHVFCSVLLTPNKYLCYVMLIANWHSRVFRTECT